TLYAELSHFNINVSVINPGFVKTRLTDLNNFKMPAIIEAEEAAQIIIKDLEAKKFEIHFPKKFTIWLKILRILPYSLMLFFTKKIAK
ncbi:MAG: short-chain dehydrogenase, partial [Proteobacteria bacterium]|nr:short-chain dehydrogenase [Pseudomonadota bacterium]